MEEAIDDAITSAAQFWYGYGRWDAPYWFIGPEPGMKKDEGDNLLERCRAWQALGSPELLDCFEHHRAFAHLKWHTRTNAMLTPINGNKLRPPTQPTWRQLIRTLLAFKGERTDNDAIGDYQCAAWGAANGETCAPELSALAARSLSVKRDRVSFRTARAEHLRTMVCRNAPRFVLMYGGGETLQPYWNYIASGEHGESPYRNETIANWRAQFVFAEPTTFVRTAHPVGAGKASPPDDYWLGIAQRLRAGRGT